MAHVLRARIACVAIAVAAVGLAEHRGTPLVVLAQPSPAPARGPVAALTHHRGVFNGQVVEYLAFVEETPVAAEGGTPTASLITTSYIRQGIADRARRPVIFAFNGGPGASSSPLHLNALGPRRYAIDDTGERVMTDNPFSPLDAADLVFIDPVGTGFSRPFPGIDGQAFWSVTGDAASVASAIEAWLRRHGREASPRFLCGESYGTTRAARIVAAHPRLGFDGVLMLSMTGGPADPDEALALLVPTFAAVAAFHGVVDAGSRSPQAVFDEAAAFARGPYLTALRRGDALAAAERSAVAGELARRIGLPATVVAERNLRVDRQAFMSGLLASRGLRTGQLDGRATGALAEFAGRKPPYDDPSMPGARPFRRPTPHLYFTEELQVAAAEPYASLNLDINARWRFDDEHAMQDPLSLVAEAMEANTRMRLFWIGGLYDLTTPLAYGQFLLAGARVPADRLTAVAAATGHMPYEGDEALERFTSAVRRFVTTR